MIPGKFGCVLFILFPMGIISADGLRKNHIENEAKKVHVQQIEGVVGHRTELPCNILPDPRRRDDTVYMVLWFRQANTHSLYQDVGSKPLYSFDVRGRGMKTAKTWSSKNGFDRRADFQPNSQPAHLLVHDLQLGDEGLYRCRVDFKNSGTRNLFVNLTVTVPPKPPVIYRNEGAGSVIVSNFAIGPYNEGADIFLSCRVSGGKPAPVVSWFLNGELVDSTYHMDRHGDVINDYHFRGLNRSHLNSQFSCKASNTRLIQSVERTVALELNLKPLFIRMRQKEQEKIVAGQEYRVVCETAGSKPSSLLRWFKAGSEITQVTTQELDGGNVTRSTLVFVPTPTDNGTSITCRAENPSLNRSQILEDVWNLNVVYPPIVDLKLGSNINPATIKQGDDVYFECFVRSNPPFKKLSWLFNGEELKHNVGNVIMSNQSLVLQGISRKQAGNYTCIASNFEGSSQSNPVHLSVMYAPVCLGTGVTVGASKGENIALRCEVEANPTAFRFEWEFHGNGDNVDVVPEGKTVSQGDLSRFFYIPQTDSEFGSFLCWASNEIGRQITPCLFTVMAAVKPHILENCTVVNNVTQMKVECSSNRELPVPVDTPLFRIMNEDNAQDPTSFPEYFILEVWDLKNRSLRRNLSAEVPNFTLKGLTPGSLLRLILYAANSHGKSDAVVIETVVAGDATFQQSTGARRSQMELFPLVAVGTACIGTLIVFIVALILRSRLCISRDRRSRLPHPVSTNGGSNGGSHSIQEKTGSVMTMAHDNVNSPMMTNNSTHPMGYQTLPLLKQHENDPSSNPDIIPGANNFTNSITDLKADSEGTLMRKMNRHHPPITNYMKEANHSLTSTLNDPLLTNVALESPSNMYGGHHPAYQQDIYHQQSHLNQFNQKCASIYPPQSIPNNYHQIHNKNDYNTIYIRDKLLHDSDIPESCV